MENQEKLGRLVFYSRLWSHLCGIAVKVGMSRIIVTATNFLSFYLGLTKDGTVTYMTFLIV